jgi:hypothetical protein
LTCHIIGRISSHSPGTDGQPLVRIAGKTQRQP